MKSYPSARLAKRPIAACASPPSKTATTTLAFPKYDRLYQTYSICSEYASLSRYCHAPPSVWSCLTSTLVTMESSSTRLSFPNICEHVHQHVCFPNLHGPPQVHDQPPLRPLHHGEIVQNLCAALVFPHHARAVAPGSGEPAQKQCPPHLPPSSAP